MLQGELILIVPRIRSMEKRLEVANFWTNVIIVNATVSQYPSNNFLQKYISFILY